jgi:dihydrofolate reductase
MRRLILYIAVSVDGKIADKDGSVDWLYAVENEEKTDYGYNKFYSSIDTTISGYNTYKQITVLNKNFPYVGKTNYVFTKKEDLQVANHVKFINLDVVEFVRNLKRQEGKDIWLVGGGKLVATLFDNDLLDEMQICIMPIIVGEGIPLFNLPTHEQVLTLEEYTMYKNGAILLRYRKK